VSWPPPCGVLGYYPNLGVAAGLGEAGEALGVLVVLGTNVVMIVAGAAITLGLQRLRTRTRRARRLG
jgi:hypothetical protein